MSRKRRENRSPENGSRGKPTNRSRPSGGQPTATDSSSFGPKEWGLAIALVVAVFLAYQPAWQGGFLWDDDAHVTSPELRSWQGLCRIWCEADATLQYYPLLHSAFWIEHKLWGDSTLGYHLVNLALLALSALMVAVILRQLKVPGAFLAAAIFALHPVHVESVAWITEQKNTLSGAFYLGAMLAYLRFDQSRRTSLYLAALGLFSLGMLSKTVIATLPGAMLVIFWWQRGRLSWKSDVLPLLPFFLLGAGGGMITAWWELKINKCDSPEFLFTPVERLLIAGRAVWFHLWKLLWPTNLTFFYPRWHIDARVWQQYLFPLAATAVLVVFWAIRRWTRAPLAAALFFGGTLVPVLGFFSLYTFRYSLVANHYQYLASLGIMTLASAGIALLLKRWRLWRHPGGYLLCLTLVAVLAVLTWRQSRTYADAEILYRTTIEQNPECALAHIHLGVALVKRRRIDEAIVQFRQAAKFDPNSAPAYDCLGSALAELGQTDEAIVQFRQAIKLDPDNQFAHNNLGIALAERGSIDEAIVHFRHAVKIKADFARAHNCLAKALAQHGLIDEAIVHYRQGAELDPDNARTHNNLGIALGTRGLIDEAMNHFQKALAINPDYPEAGRNLAFARSERERLQRVLAEQRNLLQSHPDDVALLNETARLLATNPNDSIRNGTEAVELARRAVHVSGAQQPAFLGTLAAAYAEKRQFTDAVQTAEQALALASADNKAALADALRSQLKLYRAGSPYREMQQREVSK
jgi:protein O-mannosyl-transferase